MTLKVSETQLPDLDQAYAAAGHIVAVSNLPHHAVYNVNVEITAPEHLSLGEIATREVDANPAEATAIRAALARLDGGEGTWIPDNVSVEEFFTD